MRTKLFLQILLLLIIILQAQLVRAEVLTMEQAIQLAVDESPEIKALDAQVQSSSAKSSQALAPAEPTLGLTYQDMIMPVHGISSPASRVFTFTQPFAFPGKAFLNRSILKDQTNGLRAQREAMRLQIAINVKLAYYQLALARQTIRLNEEQRAFYQRILAIAKRRYEAGAITQVDLLNAEVALHGNENDLIDLQASERTAQTQLKVLIGRADGSVHSDEAAQKDVIEVQPIRMIAKQTAELPNLEVRMVEQRNEIKAARFQFQASHHAYRLAEGSWLPDFQFTAGTTFYDAENASPWSAATPGAGAHTYFAGLQITLPIWFLFDQRQTIAAASADRSAAEANLRSVLNQSKTALDAAVVSVRSNQAKIKNFETHLLPLSEQSLSLALINYGAGRIDYQALSDTATLRRNTQRDYLTTVVQYLTADATLEQLIGGNL